MESSRGRRKHNHQRQQPLIAVVAVLTVGLIVFLLQYDFGGDTGDKANRADEHGSEFESSVTGESVNQLIEMSRNLEDNAQEEPIVRLEKLEQRLAISDRLLELEPNEFEHEFALVSKLEALMQKAIITHSEEVSGENNTWVLQSSIDENKDSENERVAELASLGSDLVDIIRFLVETNASERKILMETAFGNFKSTAGKNKENPSAALWMRRFVKLVQKTANQEEFERFRAAWFETFGGSSSEAVARLLNDDELIATASQLQGLMETVPSQRAQAIDSNSARIDQWLDQDLVTNLMLVEIDGFLTDMLRLGYFEPAKSVAQKVGNQLNESRYQHTATQKKFDAILEWIKLSEQPFENTVLADMNGEAVNDIPDAQMHVLIFLSNARLNESKRLVRNFRKFEMPWIEKAQQPVLVSVVFVEAVNSEQSDKVRNLRNFQEFANSVLPDSEVYYLNTEHDSGEEFGRQLRFQTFPFLLLCGSQNRIVAVNPPMNLIHDIFFDLR